MSADYQEGVCPPQWCWDRLNELTGIKGCWGPADWTKVCVTDRVLACAFASYIWRSEYPPEDPALEAVREAIALYDDACGCEESAECVRKGDRDDRLYASLASLRASGVLK